MIFRRRSPDDELRVHAPGEESWRCTLAEGTLAKRFLPEGTASMPQWELLGQLGLDQLGLAWPQSVEAAAARLLRARGRRGMALDVELGPSSDPVAVGTTLREFLLGLEPAGEEPEPTVVEVVQPQPVEVIVPTPVEVIAEPVEEEAQIEGLFAPAGEMLADDDRSIRPEDLAWLNPGDLLHSERRGSVRVKRVEDEARHAVVQDGDGVLLSIGFDELVREFAFED